MYARYRLYRTGRNKEIEHAVEGAGDIAVRALERIRLLKCEGYEVREEWVEGKYDHLNFVIRHPSSTSDKPEYRLELIGVESIREVRETLAELACEEEAHREADAIERREKANGVTTITPPRDAEFPTMGAAQFERLARKAIVLYAVDAKAYSHTMDDISVIATDAEWTQLSEWLNDVDADMAKTEKGTLRQKEAALAKTEGRESRYPSPLATISDEERQATVAAIEGEFRAKNVRFAGEHGGGLE